MLEWYDLNARQQATLFWGSAALLVLLVRNSNLRHSICDLIASFLKLNIFVIISSLLLTTATLAVAAVYLGRQFGLFEILPIVTSIVWAMTSGTVLLTAMITGTAGRKFALVSVTRTIAPAALLSILLDFSILPFWWEIGTLPFLATIGLVAVVASLREEDATVARLARRASLAWALVLIALAVHMVVKNPDAWVSLVESLLYPLWLTVGVLPYVYLVGQNDKIRLMFRCPSREITARDYGNSWPLTVDKARLCCRYSAV